MITTSHLAVGQGVDAHLHRLSTLKRISIDETYPALLDGLDYNEYAKTGISLLHCSENITLSSSGTRSSYRCKKKVCLTCSEINASKEAKKLAIMTDELDEDLSSGKVVMVKLSLNVGENSTTSTLPLHIKVLNKTFTAVKASFSKEIVGYLKAVEISAPDLSSGELNPHIHAGILIDPSKGAGDFCTRFKKKWIKQVRKLLAKEGHRQQVEPYAQQVEELWDQTGADALSWLKYCTKGALTGIAKLFRQAPTHNLNSKPDTQPTAKLDNQDTSLQPDPNNLLIPLNTDLWCTLHTTLKGKKSYTFGGRLRELHSNATETLKTEKQANVTEPPAPQKQYRWSWAKKTYIPAEEWDAHTDRRARFFLLSSISYLRPLPRNIYRAIQDISEANTLSDKERIKRWAKTGSLPSKHKMEGRM